MRLDPQPAGTGGGGYLWAVSLHALLLAGTFSYAHAETVSVKYRGPVDLSPFACADVSRSSFVTRVCYDRRESYMVIGLQGTYYHYCSIDDGTVNDLLK